MITLEDLVAIDDAILNTLPRKIVFLLIKNGANKRLDGSYVISANKIAEMSSLPRRSVYGVLDYLESNKVISRQFTNTNGKSWGYVYKVLYEPSYKPKAYKSRKAHPGDNLEDLDNEVRELNFDMEDLNMDQQYNFDKSL
jgi:hydroxymethylpyrimidine pyrophosphatase-like HAD family hydrolase